MLNVAGHALPRPVPARRIPTIAVVGTAPNAGRTTTAAYLVRGLNADAVLDAHEGAAIVVTHDPGAIHLDRRWEPLDGRLHERRRLI